MKIKNIATNSELDWALVGDWPNLTSGGLWESIDHLIPTGLLKLQSNLGHNKSYVSTQLTQSNSPVWSIAAVLTDTKELIYCLSTTKKKELINTFEIFSFFFFLLCIGRLFLLPIFWPTGHFVQLDRAVCPL